jgi:methionyl-tRNA formyltransferase
MNKDLRIVFMGTPEFAVATLDALIGEGYNIVGVVTAPDKPAGRGQKLQISAVKEYALQKNLKVLQPTNLKANDFIDELRSLNADLQIVVAFRMLPEIVWNMPVLGTYNLHASLLPKYRGAAPINWCIINGDKESGVTTFKLTHAIDTGSMLFQQAVPVSETMNAGELHDLLMNTGSKLMLKTVEAIHVAHNGGKPLEFFIQDDSKATHAPKIFKDTCKINWNKTTSEVHNLIRGLSPYPGAYTEFMDQHGKLISMKLFKASISNTKHANAGSLISDNKSFIKVACADGVLEIEELQLQGKRKMRVKELLNGFEFPQPLLLY